MVRFAVIFALGLTPLFAAESLIDGSGNELRQIEAARFIRGFDGGENELNYAFPLMATGQFFGNAEKPAHPTWITKPFYLAAKEVTVAQFRRFVEETGYETTAEKSGAGIVGWSPTPAEKPLYESHDFERKAEFSWKNPGFEQGDDHPVVGVSWPDARAFCAWLSKKEKAIYRLPTEAEWELAARAGATTWFSWGDDARGEIHKFANIGNVELEKFRAHAAERHWLLDLEKEPADQHVFTAPAGSYTPNGFGLFDMGGNVWEWCQDYYLDTFYGQWERDDQFSPEKTAADPVNLSERQSEASQFRVIRGGSWYTGPLQARPTNRGFFDEPDGACYLGFRVVREIPDAEPAPGRAAEVAAWKALEAVGAKIFDRDRDKAYEIELDSADLQISLLQQLLDAGPVDSLRLRGAITITPEILAAISEIDTLQALEFWGEFKITPADLAPLVSLPDLRVLSFPRQISLTDAHLAALGKMSRLEEFTGHSPQGGLTDAGVAHLAGNAGLRVLKLYEADISGACLTKLRQAPLESVAITGREISLTDENAAVLGEFPTLREVQIQSSDIGAGALRAIGALPKLQRLNLERCTGLTDADCAQLGQLSRLEQLRLSGTGAGDKTAAAIAKFDRLRDLALGSASLSDAGMSSISRIMPLEDLQIDSAAVGVGDSGLAELGRLRRLRRLKIYSPGLRGEGVASFRQISSLIELTLTSPAMTDVVFEHLSRCDSLTKLWLVERDTQPAAALTNDGLFKLQRLKNLRELWLPREHTAMTEEKMLELKALMPKCNVIPWSGNWKRG